MEDEEDCMIELPDFSNIPLKFDPPNIYVNKLYQIEKGIKEVEECINKTIPLFQEIGIDMEESGAREEVKQIEKDFLEILKQQHLVQIYQNQLNISKKIIKDSEGEALQSSLLDAFTAQVENETFEYESLSTRKKYSHNENYLQFKQNIYSVLHKDSVLPDVAKELSGSSEEDDEVLISSQKENLKCPITTNWLENPVTNKPCQHTYSRNAILGYVKKKAKAKCPVAGCNKLVVASTLISNKLLADKVERMKNREREESEEEMGEDESTLI
ncbi:hypothetical protein K502DRAFT_357222 [Neoconidiobolus thromboides FSU 785]|nr:hypothetical protein K502DRAFT_357222 [Neoconidiobolus thromboides FSU 785]